MNLAEKCTEMQHWLLTAIMLLDVMLRIWKKLLLTSNKLNVCLVELNTQVFKAASNLASNILKKVNWRQ